MTRLFIANNDTASMVPAAEELSDRYVQMSAAFAKRMIWMADAADSIITPTRISTAFLEYVAHVKGDKTATQSAALVDHAVDRPLPMTASDATQNPAVAAFLNLLTSEGEIDEVQPFFADEVAAAFAARIGAVPVSFGGAPARPDVSRHLNDKAKFREFANLMGVPIADGAVCRSDQEVLETVGRVLPFTGSVILKMALHAGGNGNHVLCTNPDSSSLGAASANVVSGMDKEALAEGILKSGFTATPSVPLVAEAYYENEASLGVYYEVCSGVANLLGAAEIMFNPTGFTGQYWSAKPVDRVPSEVMSWTQRLADYSMAIGHVGPLSIDVIKATSGGYFATEVNGRHGGFSTLSSLARSVGFGKDVANGTKVVLSRNAPALDLPFSEVLRQLIASGLHYHGGKGEGVIIFTEGYNDNGPYDFVMVGADRETVVMLEAEILRLFSFSDSES